jgi:hypothetical protein
MWAPARRKSLGLICSVWGADFTKFFCRYVVPTLLAGENLPRLAERYDVSLLLYATAADFAAMESDPGFKEMRRLAAVRCIGIESFAAPVRNHWTYWQHGVVEFKDAHDAFVMLIPDCLYAADALGRIADALEAHEVVYYTVPQACRELVVADLEHAMRQDAPDAAFRTLALSCEQLSDMFIKYINPKHAAGIDRPEFFLTHPEYLLNVGPGRVGIIEQVSHPLAIRSGAGSITRGFNPAGARHDPTYLGLLGVGCEFTLKFIEQYYRWPAESMLVSRLPTLASWSHTFREHGMAEYAGTQAQMTLSGAAVADIARAPATSRRARYVHAVLAVLQAQFAVFDYANQAENIEARRCVALAISLPGFRRRLAALGDRVTVLMPASASLGAIVQAAATARAPAALMEFCLMHVLPGQLQLKRGDLFRLWPADRRNGRTQHLQLVSPDIPNPRMSVASGTVRSHAMLVSAHVVVYQVDIDYGNVDAMLARLSGQPDAPAAA